MVLLLNILTQDTKFIAIQSKNDDKLPFEKQNLHYKRKENKLGKNVTIFEVQNPTFMLHFWPIYRPIISVKPADYRYRPIQNFPVSVVHYLKKYLGF